MRDLDDIALERRLRDVLEEHLGALPLNLTADALERRRGARVLDRHRDRRRGMTLLVAATFFLVGGALVVGSGLIRVTPELAVATGSPNAESPGPRQSPPPSATPIPFTAPGGAWIPVGTMGAPRTNPTAVRLQGGKVLVLGGYNGPWGDAHDLTSAELYDPTTGTWSAAGSTSKPVVAVTLLRDGRVLALVGQVDGGRRRAEVYDPGSGTWTASGPTDPSGEEGDVGLTVLQDGRVLLTGDGAQVYDPANGTWTDTGPMARNADLHSYSLLQDGRVLDWEAAQVFDPILGTWRTTGKRNGEGFGAAAVLLPDGRVLVAGGRVYVGAFGYRDLDLAEVYDPVSGSWTAVASMHEPARPLAAFLQPNGKVLVVSAGGSEVYDPAIGNWTASPGRPGIGYKTATLLSDGTVIATGDFGDNGCNQSPSRPAPADVYDPHIASWTTAPTMLACDEARSFTLLLDGTVLVAGGYVCSGGSECASSGAAELYVPAGVPMPPLPAFPDPLPPAVPSPTPVPTPLPPAAGPNPPNARSWTVTVENRSSESAALFVANGGFELVGSATPNVVPSGATMEVTFLFPVDGGLIYVNPRPGDQWLVSDHDIGIPGRIVVGALGGIGAGWVNP